MTRNENIQYCVDNNCLELLDSEPNLSDIQLSELVEATKYPKRRVDGQHYSDIMGARLVVLVAPDNVKKIMSEFFEQSQAFLCQGWWKSALRDMDTKLPTAYVTQELIDEIRLSMQNYINQSY